MRGFSTADAVSGAMIALQKGRPIYWNKAPATNDGSKQLTTTDVDVPGAERHEVVGRAYGVGRDVDTKGDNEQANSAKGRGSSASVRARFAPVADNDDRIPDDLAVRRLRGGSSKDSKETDNREDDGNDNDLDILRVWRLRVSCEIRNVQSKSCVVAQHTVQICKKYGC